MVFLVKFRWLFFLFLLLIVIVSGSSRKNPLVTLTTRAVPLPTSIPEANRAKDGETSKERADDHINGDRCVELPVIIYHHVEPATIAKEEGREGLSVDNRVFRGHIEYLRKKGYSSITPEDLVDFFDGERALPSKPVMITFDDGYEDNGDFAFEVLRELGMKATIFIPTGLMHNEGYLRWEKIMEMNASGIISFGNHTWSHMSAGRDKELVKKEITTADFQLSERGLNRIKTFAYPYGEQNGQTKKYLEEMGYQLGFTTRNGRMLCKEQRLSLPRVRVGNGEMSEYGL